MSVVHVKHSVFSSTADRMQTVHLVYPQTIFALKDEKINGKNEVHVF